MSEFFPYIELFEDTFFHNGEFIEYEKSQHLVWRKDKSEWVFFLITGLVRVSYAMPDKSNRIIGYFPPGMVFAQSGSFFRQHDGILSYTTEKPSTVYRMKRGVFLKLLKENPELMHEYLHLTLRNQLFLIDRIAYQGEKGLFAKCARWLLFMAKYYGKSKGNHCEIVVPMTQETAANFLGATRESLNVVLRELEDKKYIALATKKIVIKDVTGLRAIVN